MLERLTAEIDGLGADPAVEAVARLPYLEAVCNEVLRLCPPAPEALRPPFDTRRGRSGIKIR